MKLTVLLVDGSFRENFHTIECLEDQTLDPQDYELLWVEFYQDVREQLKNFGSLRVVALGNSDEVEYHSSYCFNEGIRQSQGDILVIMDADVIVEQDFLETVLEEHSSCEELAMYFYRINEPRRLHVSRKSYTLDHLKERGVYSFIMNHGGCLSVRKKWLVEINGYDQDPVFSSGFHTNGLDVYTRLKNLGLHIKWHPSLYLYHPWHPYTLTVSANYDIQTSVVKKRAKSLVTLPNWGLDPSRDKQAKDLPDISMRRQGFGKIAWKLLRLWRLLLDKWVVLGQ